MTVGRKGERMSIALAEKFAPYTDELFKAESKLPLLTNQDFDWTGAHTVKIYKISTMPLNDYARNRFTADPESPESISRYGALLDLNAATEEMILTQDKSFIFNVDKMDQDETAQQLEAGKALARELREVVIPTVDTFVYDKIVDGAGTTAEAAALDKDTVYPAILAGSEVLDNNEVPDTDRVLIVTPAVYSLLKQAAPFDNNDVGAELRMQGVVGFLDGMSVVRVPAARLPEDTGFVIVHPSATVCAYKLEDYNVHQNTPLSSGDIVTGRIVYDAFVLENKACGIYVQPLASE